MIPKNALALWPVVSMLALGITAFAPDANAEQYLITFRATAEVNDPRQLVFGQTSTTPVVISFTLDTSIAPVTVLPAGTGGFATELFGYDAAAVEGFTPVFGTKAWEINSLSPRPVAGVSADLWFDQALGDRINPNTWVLFEDGEGSIQFGGGVWRGGAWAFFSLRVC